MPRPVKCRKVCHFPNVLEFLPADDTEKKARALSGMGANKDAFSCKTEPFLKTCIMIK